MTLDDMRRLGVGCIQVECRDCSHVAVIKDDGLLDGVLPVADLALRMRCPACGSKVIETVPGGS